LPQRFCLAYPPTIRKTNSYHLKVPIDRQVGLGFGEDIKNSSFRFGRNLLIIGAVIFTGENRPEAMIKMLAHWVRQALECFGVNQIAAGELEEPRSQVQLAKRAALFVFRPLGFKPL